MSGVLPVEEQMTRLVAIAAALMTLGTVAATAQQPDRQGRYSMSPSQDGSFLRLDTETGGMAVCQRRNEEWSCREMEDEGRTLRQENERLAKQNEDLKSELRRLEDNLANNSAKPGDDNAERPGNRLQLPSEQDVDQAFNYIQRMLKKFREKMKELEGDREGTPL